MGKCVCIFKFVCDINFVGCKCSVEVQSTWSFASAALMWFSGILMRMGTTLVFIFTYKISVFSAGGL
jgi:hypothetical protein